MIGPISIDICELVDSKVLRALLKSSASLSRRTQVGSSHDDRLKDCSMELGGWLMVWDVIFYDGVMSLQPPMFEGEEIGFLSIYRINYWRFSHRSLSQGIKVCFITNHFCLAAKERLMLICNYGSLAAMKVVSQVES